MKVDFSKPLMDIYGRAPLRIMVEPAVRQDGRIIPALVEEMTLQNLTLTALQQQPGAGQDLKAHWRTFGLLVRIAQGGDVELTAAEVTTIMAALVKSYDGQPTIIGRAKEILDPE